MQPDISHTGFFGDGMHTFCLTDDMLTELERLAGTGIGAIYATFVAMQFSTSIIVEAIRLGLIGGGASPEHAKRLTDTYARNRPLGELFPLALSILDARWHGAEPNKEATDAQ